MNTNWYNSSLDARGSLNLPADIKRHLNLGVASPLFIREVEGIIILVPIHGDVEAAQKAGDLENWVNDRLHSALPPAPVTLGTTALAEAARTQRAREKHEMKMREMDKQLEIYQARREAIRVTTPRRALTSKEQVVSDAAKAPVDDNAIAEMLAKERAAREAQATPDLQLPQG